MATFGYKAPTFGAYPHSPGLNPSGASAYTGAVGSALAGSSPLSGSSGYGGYGGYPAFKTDAGAPAAAPPSTAPAAKGAAAPQPTAPRAPASAAPAPGVYDLNTDPILQQIQAFTGMGDQQAQAAATKQQQQLLLGYGDQNLAQQVLGQNDPTAQAAGQNLTSVLAQLGQQHNQQETSYGNQLDPSLFYSGARVLGEQQLAQDYQNALAAAGQNVQGGLDTISGNLAAALAANQQQRIQGANDAYGRAIQMPPVASATDPSSAPAPSDFYQTGSNVGTVDSPWLAQASGIPVGAPIIDPGMYMFPGPAAPPAGPTRMMQGLGAPQAPQQGFSPLTLPSLISLLGQRVAG